MRMKQGARISVDSGSSPHELTRARPRQLGPWRWTDFIKLLLGYSAVLALMSAVLYSDVWPAPKNVTETAQSGELLASGAAPDGN